MTPAIWPGWLFIMDRIMHALGLHGKSFIPMLMGFGCSVPAIMATRGLSSQRDRILTMMLIPLMSCSARLPVYVLFAGVFFPQQAGQVIFGLYLFGIVMSVLLGMLFNRILLKGQEEPFVMELPPYRLPRYGASSCTCGIKSPSISNAWGPLS